MTAAMRPRAPQHGSMGESCEEGGVSPPEVCIVVLNWNGREDTLACLESVHRIAYPNTHVILADNGSTDGALAAVAERFPSVQLIDNGSNLGFAAGNNSAIAAALDGGAEFIFLLNNDTIVDTGIVSAFVQAAHDIPGGGIFGGKIYLHSDPKRLWYAGGYWDPRTLSFGEHGAGQVDDGQFDKLTETEWVIGCAMFIRASVFRRVGLLEPKFFLNNEELDFCSRAQRAGFTCVFVPAAVLWHKVSASFGGEDSPLKEYFSGRNRMLWARRNAAWQLRWRMYLGSTRNLLRRYSRPLLAVGGLPSPGLKSWWWGVVGALRDPRNKAFAIGYRDFWLGRFGDCPDEIRALSAAWSARRASRRAAGSAAPAQH